MTLSKDLHADRMTKPVATAAGLVKGLIQAGVCVFRGIPFAAPISGRNRWRPPQAVETWSGVREAVRDGPACYQPGRRPILGRILRATKPAGYGFVRTILQFHGSEGDDCLNLNVWTPTLDPGAKLPVLVWIHGGGFQSGAGSMEFYDGSTLASRGLVVVNINYRLSTWGFVGADGLFRDDVGGANRGFLDQLQALRWISANIRAFGGDPDCVTVMGESAGAMSAMALAGSPLTEGLMRRAVSLSAAQLCACPNELYASFSRDYFASVLHVKAPDVDALLKLDIETVRRASPDPDAFLARHRDRYGALGRNAFKVFGTTVTGTQMFPTGPLEYLRSGRKPDLDLMIGSCRDEARQGTICIPLPERMAAKVMFKSQSRMMNPAGQPRIIFNNYQSVMPGESDIAIYERATTDATVRRWSIEYANAHASMRPGRTFLHRFDWRSPAFEGRIGAIHAIDVSGVFQSYRTMLPILGSEAAARPAGDALHQAIVSFVKTGRPEVTGIGNWEPYSPEKKACMLFNDQCRLEYGVDTPFERFW